MFAISVNQNFWGPQDLSAAQIPESAKQFLAKVGLPTFVADFSFELGVHDAELPQCVIGVDGEDGIVIDEHGMVRVLMADVNETIFVNSSVENFSRFLYAMEIFKRTASSNDEAEGNCEEENKKALKSLREGLASIDAEAMTNDARHLWPLLVNDMGGLWF